MLVKSTLSETIDLNFKNVRVSPNIIYFHIRVPINPETFINNLYNECLYLNNDLNNVLELNNLITNKTITYSIKEDEDLNSSLKVDYIIDRKHAIIYKPLQFKFNTFEEFVTQFIVTYQIRNNEYESMKEQDTTEYYFIKTSTEFRHFIISNTDKIFNLYDIVKNLGNEYSQKDISVRITEDIDYVHDSRNIDIKIYTNDDIFHIRTSNNSIESISINDKTVFNKSFEDIMIYGIHEMFTTIDIILSNFVSIESKLKNVKNLLKNNPEISLESDTLTISDDVDTIELSKNEVLELLKR